jgi:hypothetical protein
LEQGSAAVHNLLSMCMSEKVLMGLSHLLVLLSAFFLQSCNKTDASGNYGPLPPAQGIPVQVTIDPQHPSYSISPDYLGLSFEMTAITDSNYFNPANAVFIRLIKNLGTGIVRIGANGVDKTYWSGQTRYPSMAKDSIASTDIDRFSLFIRAIGWKTIFGLNCGGNFNPSTAAEEAKYVSDDLSGLLQSFEVGNEADLYPRNGFRTAAFSVSDFDDEWGQYYQAVESASPHSIFSGPAFAYNRNWLTAFAQAESSRINELTIHYYQAGPGTDTSINLNTLLAPKADSAIDFFGHSIAAIANGVDLPYRIAECNSIYGGGKTNVSNTFGASLWALDFMWRLAYTGCTGINFHGGGNGPYSPIGYSSGSFFPKPEYYSMLFFKYGAQGHVLPCTVESNNKNVTVYASKTADGKLYVTIINKEPETSLAMTMQTGAKYHSVSLESMTAANLNATEGISFQGHIMQSNGTMITSSPQTYSINDSSFTVHTAAASALLVVVSP